MRAILCILVISGNLLFPQNQDKNYSFTLETAGGYGRYFTSMHYRDINRNGVEGLLRVMWNPEHILSVGIESGYQTLYNVDRNYTSPEFGSSHFKLRLSSIPAAVVFSMRVLPESFPGLRLIGGSGIAMLHSKGEFYSYFIDNSQISLYYRISAAYMEPLNNRISLGGEIKFSHFSKPEDSDVTFMLLFVYRFLVY